MDNQEASSSNFRSDSSVAQFGPNVKEEPLDDPSQYFSSGTVDQSDSDNQPSTSSIQPAITEFQTEVKEETEETEETASTSGAPAKCNNGVVSAITVSAKPEETATLLDPKEEATPVTENSGM